MKINVVKKPVTSDVKNSAESDQKKIEEDSKTSTTNGLQSLCQYSDSDED